MYDCTLFRQRYRAEIVAVVPTGPVSLRWNTRMSDIEAEPVSFPESVSVPDTGVVVALAVAGGAAAR